MLLKPYYFLDVSFALVLKSPSTISAGELFFGPKSVEPRADTYDSMECKGAMENQPYPRSTDSADKSLFSSARITGFCGLAV